MKFETASTKSIRDLITLCEYLVKVSMHRGGLSTVMADFLRQKDPGDKFDTVEFLRFVLHKAPDPVISEVHYQYQKSMDSMDVVLSTPEWEGADEDRRKSLCKDLLDRFVREAEAHGLLSKGDLKWFMTGVAISQTGDMSSLLAISRAGDMSRLLKAAEGNGNPAEQDAVERN